MGNVLALQALQADTESYGETTSTIGGWSTVSIHCCDGGSDLDAVLTLLGGDNG